MKLNYLCATLVLLLAGCSRSAESYLENGNKLFAKADYPEAAINFTKAIQKNPQHGEAYYQLGLTYVKLDQAIAAYRALHAAVGLLPGRADAKVALADVCFALYVTDARKPQAMYEEAAQLTSQILATNPSSPDGFRLKGALALLDRKLDESIEAYRRANELRSMDGDIILGYGQALMQAGKLKEAESLMADFLDKNPKSRPVYDPLYRIYMSAKRFGDAESLLRRWIEKSPEDPFAVLKLAGHFLYLQKPAEMGAALQRMLDDRKNYPMAFREVGDFYAGQGRWAEAYVQYERGAKADAGNAPAYRKRMVDALLAQGKREEAIGVLDALIKQSPKDADARAGRARLWIADGKPDRVGSAVAELTALLQEPQKNPVEEAQLRLELGRAQLLKGDLAAARSSFRQAIQSRPDLLPARYELAQMAAADRNGTEVLRYAEEILRLKPEDPAGKLLRGTGFMLAGRFPEARGEFRVLLKDYPQFRDAQFQMGLVALSEGKLDEAEEAFRKLSASDAGDIRPVLGLASAYAARSHFDQAIQTLTEAGKKAPQSRLVDRLIGLTALGAQKYDLAISAFERLVASDPSSLDSHLDLARALLLSGKKTESIGVLDKARQLDLKKPSDLLALSTGYYGADRAADAAAILRRCLQIEGDNAVALNNLAFLLVETSGDLAEAQKFAELAVQKSANKTGPQDTLGWIYLKRNVVDSALRIFETAVTKEPDNPTFRYHLGVALLKKGEKERARTELNSALARKPKPSEEKSIRELLAGIG